VGHHGPPTWGQGPTGPACVRSWTEHGRRGEVAASGAERVSRLHPASYRTDVWSTVDSLFLLPHSAIGQRCWLMG
jgi:hypothetical protein